MAAEKKKILIIDDEQAILSSLSRLLNNHGYSVRCLEDASHVLGELKAAQPDLIMLDLWMPEPDGYTVLKKIRSLKQKIPIIVMSGHASVTLSSETVKRGADDFIEKPFSSDALLYKLRSLLNKKQPIHQQQSETLIKKNLLNLKIPQRTLAKNIVAKGTALHSGHNTGIILQPFLEDGGIIFEDISTNNIIKANVQNVLADAYAVTLSDSQGFHIKLIEHLLAALHIYGIDNLKVKVSGEIPIFDGSALPFCKLIEDGGVKEQASNKKVLVLKKKIRIVDASDSTKTLEAEPYDGLHISYLLRLPQNFGDQYYQLDFGQEQQSSRIDIFKKEIAPCRTFGFLEETRNLQSSGMARGATLGNAVLLDEGRVINAKLRYKNELARHKIIDILGDLYLLGVPLRAKITARGTGHRHNIALVKKILNPES